MEIYHLGRLCLLVTALLSIDLYTKFSLISLSSNAAKSCSYLYKLLSKRPEVGSSYFAQFVTGVALFFAFSVGWRVLNFSLRPISHLRHGDCLNSKICGLMEPRERPDSEFEDGNSIMNGDSRSFEGSGYSDSEGSLHEDQVFNEMCLREFSLGSDICDTKELFGRPSRLIENGHSVSNGNPHSDAGCENSQTEELFPEDQTPDEMLLRELVKFERQRAEAALSELEKERLAATTAAEEAMSMIMRLQREKSSIEIEAKQYRRLAEDKQVHDQEVIGFLRSVIAELERDLNALAEELCLCSRRLSCRDRCNCSDGTDGFEDGAEEHDLRMYDNGDSPMGVSFDEELEDESTSSPVFDALAL